MKTRIQNLFSALALLASIHQAAAQTSFGSSTDYHVGNAPQYVAAADIRRSGSVDLISANVNDNTLTILTNNGNGVFGSNATLHVGSNPVWVVAFTNVDNYVDLVCANRASGTLTLLTNNGSGIFTSNTSYTVGYIPVSVTVADINKDQKPDLICANYGDSSLSVLTNNGSGGFVPATTVSGSFRNPTSVAAIDVNGDGYVDLISPDYDNASGHLLCFMTNSGSGIFSDAYTISVDNSPYDVISANINGDGKTVLICANQNSGNNYGSLSVITNNNGSNFAVSGSYGVGQYPISVVAADVNGDHKLDLICANDGNFNLEVLTNDGAGIFSPAVTLPVGNSPNCVATADVNGDGKPDLISANVGGTTLTVWLNTSIFPAVPLGIASAGNQSVLFWSASLGTNYVLQSTTNLSPTPNWTTVSNGMLIIGITLTNNLPAAFFRLQQQ